MQDDELLRDVLEGDGVGSQLWRVLQRLGIQHRPECSCIILADIMNDLGPEGCCQPDNRELLLKLMQKNWKRYGWFDIAQASARSILTGLAFKVNPTDPLPGLLDYAIKLAETAQCSGRTE